MRAYRMLNRGASLAAVCEPHPERAGLTERSRRRAAERDRHDRDRPKTDGNGSDAQPESTSPTAATDAAP